MSEMSFEQMLEESFKSLYPGEVVKGTVLDVKKTEAILNIGYKSDGILNIKEYSNDNVEDLRDHIHVNDELDVMILKLNDSEGQVVLSHKRVLSQKGLETLKNAYETGEILKAKVVRILKGGVCVVVDEAKVFIPASLISDSFERDLSKYLNQEVEFVITEFNPHKNRVIGNRKKIIAEQKRAIREELFSRVGIGDTIEGTVKNIADFGAFIDIGGIDGLLHISEMSWNRVGNPKDTFKVGDKVKVFIKDIREDKVALSMKFPDENPWKIISEKYSVGSIIKGKVARMAEFGAFVEIEDGIDGLLHVSQISYDHISKPSDVLKIGDEVEAKIIDFNEMEHKISLSVKALMEPPVKEEPVNKEDESNETDESNVDSSSDDSNVDVETTNETPEATDSDN